MLIKFHGSYQQEDRDQRQERKRDGEALGDWATRAGLGQSWHRSDA